MSRLNAFSKLLCVYFVTLVRFSVSKLFIFDRTTISHVFIFGLDILHLAWASTWISCASFYSKMYQVLFHWGWPLPFLLNGFLGIIWFVIWMYVAADSPDCHSKISKNEYKYIIALTETSEENRYRLPWQQMLKSPPFYAFLFVVTTVNTVDFGLLTGLPLYFSNVLNYDVTADGFLCAVPWFCNVLGTLISSCYTDYLRGHHLVSTTLIRKVNQLMASVIPGVFLIAAGYAECNSGLSVCFISVAAFFFGFYYAASFCSSLDMAPYFAGTCTTFNCKIYS